MRKLTQVVTTITEDGEQVLHRSDVLTDGERKTNLNRTDRYLDDCRSRRLSDKERLVAEKKNLDDRLAELGQ